MLKWSTTSHQLSYSRTSECTAQSLGFGHWSAQNLPLFQPHTGSKESTVQQTERRQCAEILHLAAHRTAPFGNSSPRSKHYSLEYPVRVRCLGGWRTKVSCTAESFSGSKKAFPKEWWDSWGSSPGVQDWHRTWPWWPKPVPVTTRPAKEGQVGSSLRSGSSKCNISARTLKHIQVTTWDFIQLIKDTSTAVTQVTISRGICGLPTEMRIYHQTFN